MVALDYKTVYDEEASTTQTTPALLPGMLNRNTTDGKWGIWGHELGDLIVHTLVESEDGAWQVQCDS